MSKLPFIIMPEPQPLPTFSQIILTYLFDVAVGAACLAAGIGVLLLCAAVLS